MNARKYSALPGDSLFDPDILNKLDFSKHASKFNPAITSVQPGSSLLVRPLCSSDYEKGFLQLLSQLTNVGHVSREEFLRRFSAMKNCANTYYVIVIEDINISQIIGAATLVIEQKFVHDACIRGLLEDVVVNDNYRGRQLGKLIVTTVSLLAEYLGCYKLTLNCKDNLITFYESVDYAFEPNQSNSCMTMHFTVPRPESTFP